MPHERFFIDMPLNTEEQIFLIDAEHRHLCRVMRAQVGDLVELVNGRYQLATASIDRIESHRATLSVGTVTVSEPTSPRLILAQAIPRLPRLEYILEKATELGVSEVHLFPSQFSERSQFSDHQRQRMTHITISALKQCGRLDLPPIHILPPLLEWKRNPGLLLFGETSSQASPLQKIDLGQCDSVTMVIGPEKGLSEKEAVHLREGLGATGVKLHTHILRVDTAAIAALAQLYMQTT